MRPLAATVFVLLGLALSACGGSATPTPAAPTTEPAGPCMVDAADDRLKRCDAPTPDGRCTAYGAWCTNDDLHRAAHDNADCLREPATGRMRHCTELSGDGLCLAWGHACHYHDLLEHTGEVEPCLFDVGEKRYRRCLAVTQDAVCTKFGDGCLP